MYELPTIKFLTAACFSRSIVSVLVLLQSSSPAASANEINFVGLEWDEACLNFHQNKRAVRTASITQVRKPIYQSSIAKWKRYEEYLGPLLAALGDLAPID